MKEIFKALDTLEQEISDLGYVNYWVGFKTTSNFYDSGEINIPLDKIHEVLKNQIIGEIYSGLKPIICELADMAKTSEHTNVTEIQKLVADAFNICNGN